jgi:hypothetical protein
MTVTGRLVLDEHVASVVEFMEKSLPADRLEYVATRLPALARVLWSVDRCASVSREKLSTANESGLAGTYADDDSAVVGGVGERKPHTSRIPRNGKSLNTVSGR